MIYVIDHNDSFTHNVVHQFSLYDEVECDNYNNLSKTKLTKAKVIVFSPGPGNPKNYTSTSRLYKKIKGTKKIIEEYKDLFHYVSLIKGKLKKNIKNIDIIKAMMPGGSVIGCPKISTLNLLNEQEKENRNIYTGSFGYIKFNGDMRFNIIIRSILNFKNISEISVASGVVVDSNAQHEFSENYIKAKALIDLFK